MIVFICLVATHGTLGKAGAASYLNLFFEKPTLLFSSGPGGWSNNPGERKQYILVTGLLLHRASR